MSDLLFIQSAYQNPTPSEIGAAKIALARFVLVGQLDKSFTNNIVKDAKKKLLHKYCQHLRGTLFKAFLMPLSTAGRVPKVNGM